MKLHFRWTWRTVLFRGLLLVCLVMAAVETLLQMQDDRFVTQIARDVVRRAGATDDRSRVIALRDFLRGQISSKDAPVRGRPFLRDTAGATLRSQKGYCGEVTRAFINMAEGVGVRATRINLWGKDPHVVAEAVLGSGERVIVDGTNPPLVKDLVSLDSLISRGQWWDYYTVNLRRLRLNWLVSRVRVESGPIMYLLEKPHLLAAALWLSLALFLIALAALRHLIIVYLRARGWQKITNPAS